MRVGNLALRLLSAATVAAFVAVISIGGSNSAEAAEDDTVVIAIPGLPQGVDLDRHIGPQT